MLDNFDAQGLRQAAATVKDKCPHVTIEASGVGGTASEATFGGQTGASDQIRQYCRVGGIELKGLWVCGACRCAGDHQGHHCVLHVPTCRCHQCRRADAR